MECKGRFTSWEIRAYFVIWCASLGYAVYNVYEISQELSRLVAGHKYLDLGWKIFGGVKDIPEQEWKSNLNTINTLYPWIIIHLLGSEILRHFQLTKVIPIWYTLISSSYCLHAFGTTLTLLIWVQPSLAVLLILLQSTVAIWISALIFVGVINFVMLQDIENTDMTIYVVLAWMTLKSTSCALDLHQKYKNTNSVLTLTEISQVFGYNFYLPSLIFGPIQIWDNFINQKPEFESLGIRLKKLVLNGFRFFGWILFTEIFLHFVYVTALQWNIEIVGKSFWAICGLGYCMGQMFHLKYTVQYGVSTMIAGFEGISSPELPICIAHVHLYSNMWKYFDRGLYFFLLRYIYIPISTFRKRSELKFIASFFCFGFVFVWHGMRTYILVWSLMNYIGILIESYANGIEKSQYFQKHFVLKLSPRNYHRFKAMIAVPLMIASALSNFFFFGGYEIGVFFVQQLFQADWVSLLTLFACTYTLCQVSMEFQYLKVCKRNDRQKTS